MSNYEILKECKNAYEILNDLYDNCNLLDIDNDNNLRNTMEDLEEIYTKAYERAIKEKEDLKPQKKVHCNHCGKEMAISDLIGYAYLCNDCDENMYLCEGDINYAWWQEDNRIN